MDAFRAQTARHKAGLELLELPFWAEQAYLVGTGVYAQIAAEEQAAAGDGDGSSQTDFQVTGAGDSGVFADVLKAMKGR